MQQADSADALIEQLELSAHPEGGWYRETWRAETDGDASAEKDQTEKSRARGTAILFLLKAGEHSHWHRVDADEMWLWQSGDPLELRIAKDDAGPVRTLTLSDAADGGHQLQGLVPNGAWQAARAASPAAPPPSGAKGYSLVSCVVVPGFEFAGFELAEPGWEPGGAIGGEKGGSARA